MAFQKDSPYHGLFNYYIKRMKQDGSLDKFVKSYENLPQVCPDNTGMPLGFNNLMFPFLVMVSGCLISLIVVMIEYIHRVINPVNPKGNEESQSGSELVTNPDLRTQSTITVETSEQERIATIDVS